MGFTEFLTIVFVVLKLIGTIDWSWWWVLLPEIIAAVFYLIAFIAGLMSVRSTKSRCRSIEKKLTGNRWNKI